MSVRNRPSDALIRTYIAHIGSQQRAAACIAAECRAEQSGVVIQLLPAIQAVRDKSSFVVRTELDELQLADCEMHAKRDAFLAKTQMFVFPCGSVSFPVKQTLQK